MNTRTKHTILLIEDNPGDARLIQEYLSEPSFVDFQLVHAASLKEGIERLTAGGIDLVLLDLTLPDCTGLETFTRVAAVATETPIIVLSGQDDESLAMNTPVLATNQQGLQHLVRDGVNGFIINAQDPADLAAKLPRALQLPRSTIRATIPAEFTLDAMVEQTLAVYRELLAATGR